MAKRKIVRASEKGEKAADGVKADSLLVKGVWGLVYLALGVLMLISMLFHQFIAGKGAASHILGDIVGTSMAIGLFFVFGRITSFAFAAAVCYIGVAKIANRPLRLKLLLFIGILMLETCLILAVKHMPQLSAGGLMATADAVGVNFAGLLMISALIPLFGGQTFGPYFIVSLLMAITIMIGLRIRPQTVAALVWRWVLIAVKWVKKAFSEIVSGIRSSPDIRKPSADKPAETAGGRPKAVKDKVVKDDKNIEDISDLVVIDDCDSGASQVEEVAAAPRSAVSKDDDVNGELSPETEEWLKKKHEPIQIITMSAAVGSDTANGADEATSIPADAIIVYDDNELSDNQSIENDNDERDENDDGGDSDGFKVNKYIEPAKPYVVPSHDILSEPPPLSDAINEDAIRQNAEILEKTLKSFGVEGRVVAVSPGPVVTRYEIELAPGVKVSKVTGLQDDISLAVSGLKIRIQAPIPGKAAIGIELPNAERQIVHFKHILVSEKFKKSKAAIPIVIGSNISGAPYVTDIDRMPHLLIAGQTGAGKSVCMNSLICSLLMTKKPEELRLIMIDPKQVEFAPYENIPHLLAPVVTEAAEAVKALKWGVMEMERRYTLFKTTGTKKIDDFNERFENSELGDALPEEDNRYMPYVLIIVDELADLMMTAPKDVEGLIMRIAQKARAAGIHLILATQRPSVNVITGPIKANLPSRIAFRTVQANDSRTILDQGGAEKLLGKGDMLFLLNGEPDIERLHGAFISDKDVKAIVTNICEQQIDMDDKIESFHDVIEDPIGEGDAGDNGDDCGQRDKLFADAARITVSIGQGSTSLLQRRMNIGFARAGRIMDQLERAGIVGPSKGSKTREVLIRPEELEDYL